MRLTGAPSFAPLARALLTLALCWPAQAQAFSVSVPTPTTKTFVKWYTNKVMYYLHPSGTPDIGAAASLDELRLGWKGWMDINCTGLQFIEGYHCNTAQGKCLYDKSGGVAVSCSKDADCPSALNVKVVPIGYNPNNRNELVFVENADWQFGKYVLGVTSPVFGNNGAILEADIAFNGYSQKWTTKSGEAGSGTQHLLSVAIHEQGHFFGAQHVLGGYNAKDPPTMAPVVQPFGMSATLNTDDQKVACFLNPKSGPYTCGTDADCPYINAQNQQSGEEYYSAKLVCNSGSCAWSGAGTPVGGTTALGGVCTASKDCKTGLFCQPFGSQAYCSQECTVTAKNCPTGYTCYAYQNGGGKGACLPGQGEPTPTKTPGTACSSSAECTTLMCLDNVCRVKCTTGNPIECAKGTEQCAPIPSAGYGGCLPVDQPAQKLPLGAKCFDATECDSGACLKADLQANYGLCRQKCSGKGTCPSGFSCIQQVEGFMACLPGNDKVPVGSACTGTGDCDTNLCIDAGNAMFCSKNCDLNQVGVCPCGMACTSTSIGPICYPGTKQACVSIGQSCTADSECFSGLCAGGLCVASCDVGTGQGGCLQGEACLRVQNANSRGRCEKTGATNLGDLCAQDSDCKSLLCAPELASPLELRCQKPCDPSQDSCGPGLACRALGVGLGACVLVEDIPNVPDVPVVGSLVPSNSSGCAAGGRAAPAGLALLFAALALMTWRRRSRV
ncbi:MAG: hypothetical protein ACOYOB_02060 [Myxococcota bacterium]